MPQDRLQNVKGTNVWLHCASFYCRARVCISCLGCVLAVVCFNEDLFLNSAKGDSSDTGTQTQHTNTGRTWRDITGVHSTVEVEKSKTWFATLPYQTNKPGVLSNSIPPLFTCPSSRLVCLLRFANIQRKAAFVDRVRLVVLLPGSFSTPVGVYLQNSGGTLLVTSQTLVSEPLSQISLLLLWFVWFIRVHLLLTANR